MPIFTYTGQFGGVSVKCGTWKSFYSDGAGTFTELPLGAQYTSFVSGGAAAAPAWSLLADANIDAAAAIAWSKLAASATKGALIATDAASGLPVVLPSVTAGRFLVSAGAAAVPYYPASADLFWDNATKSLRIGGYSLPATDGTPGQVPTTDGAGTVAWASPAVNSVVTPMILWPMGETPITGDLLCICPMLYAATGDIHVDLTKPRSVAGCAVSDFTAGLVYPDDYVLHCSIVANGGNWDFMVYRDAAKTQLLTSAINVAAAGVVTTTPEAGSSLVITFQWEAGAPAAPGVATLLVVPDGCVIPAIFYPDDFDGGIGGFRAVVCQTTGAGKGDPVDVLLRGLCDVNVSAAVGYGVSLWLEGMNAGFLKAKPAPNSDTTAKAIGITLEPRADAGLVACDFCGYIVDEVV